MSLSLLTWREIKGNGSLYFFEVMTANAADVLGHNDNVIF